jgi:hypothetical protein
MRMKKLLSLVVCFMVTLGLSAQDKKAMEYAATITADDLREHLTILASDALEGRETGKRGQKMAAAYIRYHFEQLGLAGPVNHADGGGYLQHMDLYASMPGEVYVKIKDRIKNNMEQIIYYGSATTDGEVSVEAVFGGNGEESVLSALKLQDKALVVFAENMRSYRQPLEKARELGAKAVFVVSTTDEAEFATLARQFRGFLSGGRLSVKKPDPTKVDQGVFFMSPATMAELFGTDIAKLKKAAADAESSKGKSVTKVKPARLAYRTEQLVKTVKTENVLGYLEGTDKKDEVIVITSHYDHIGRDGNEINNGADDDGSGTVAVLELAEAFAKAAKEGNRPRRSILFMTVTGEEKGLLGSQYYAENPIFPLEKTMVNLNIDMIGRIDPEHENNQRYVYLVGSDKLSTELHTISESTNATYTKLELDYTYNDPNHPERIYYRSDHWNFAKNGIPVIFYFNGVHADYHKPTDTVEKIAFEVMTERAKLVFFTAWELANREKSIVADLKTN